MVFVPIQNETFVTWNRDNGGIFLFLSFLVKNDGIRNQQLHRQPRTKIIAVRASPVSSSKGLCLPNFKKAKAENNNCHSSLQRQNPATTVGSLLQYQAKYGGWMIDWRLHFLSKRR